MANDYTTMTLDAIKFLCSVINQTVDLPKTVISDNSIATNTTYSSYKISKNFDTLEDELKHYTDMAIAGLNKLTKEIINDKALAVKDNVLYLYKADDNPSNDYMQMMLINGVAVELGSTQVDMDDYYNKIDSDDRFLKKSDATTTYATIDNVNGKVDKTDIATSLDNTVTDEQVTSALLTKTELDKLSDSLVDLESMIDGVYTTEEKVIGKWIDGKPLYRKVATIPNFSTGNYQATALGINDVETMVNVDGYLTNSTYANIRTGGFFAEGYSVVIVYRANKTFQTEIRGFATGKFTLITEYTKTTD